MKQTAAQKKIINIFTDHFGRKNIRIIKIHGGRYQERGLPDIMILVESHKIYCPCKVKHFWIELKRDWSDIPTALQKWNIEDLKKFGYVTGYFTGDEFKTKWDDVPIKMKDYLEKHY